MTLDQIKKKSAEMLLEDFQEKEREIAQLRAQLDYQPAEVSFCSRHFLPHFSRRFWSLGLVEDPLSVQGGLELLLLFFFYWSSNFPKRNVSCSTLSIKLRTLDKIKNAYIDIDRCRSDDFSVVIDSWKIFQPGFIKPHRNTT